MSRIQVKKDERPVSVDICCPVYNHGAYLRQALDSFLMQKTTFPFRIIIHDDASNDNSADIIREYQRRYPEKIVAIIEEENLYQKGKSIFEIMRAFFTAKYIAHCEGDDYWLDENKLQKQVDYLENNPDCAAVYHNILPVNKNGVYDESLRIQYKVLEEGDYTKEEIKTFQLYTQTASLVRRNYRVWMSEEQKKFNDSIKCNGDAKLLIVLGSIGRVHYLPDVMSAYRKVVNEGDSYSSHWSKMNQGERLLFYEKLYLDFCSLYEYFWEEKNYLYTHLLDKRLSYFRQRPDLVKEVWPDLIKIPFYAYILYFPRFCHKCFPSVKNRVKKILLKGKGG